MKRALLLAVAIASCRPASIDWGLDAIDTMQTPADPPVSCGFVPPVDAHEGERAACRFGAGARARDTLGVSRDDAAKLPIRHVIIAMKENRSFDQIFGKLHDAGQPGVEAIPATYSNPDLQGNPVFPSHATTTCTKSDPPHQSDGMQACIDAGKMDGFVRNAASGTGTDGLFAIQYYEPADLPFYYFLATTYAIGDRHFAPYPSGTYANRTFMMFGTTAGVRDTGVSYPPPSTPSIFQTLMVAGYTWGAYTDGGPFSGALGWKSDDPGVHPTQALYDALDRGTLPNVAFVDGIEDTEDDHPPGDLQVGEAWLKRLYDHAVKSPQWERLAIVFTYDEAGAFFDHVPPPQGCRVNGARPEPDVRGIRVPIVMISPWAKRNYVSHVVRDHTSITRFVETLFDLPALGARDANADALLDMLDFSCGKDRSVPAAPPAGTGGCK